MENQVRIITIGVYGFEEDAFFAALAQAGVDTFCDIRRRRGLRGATYAFANSKRLQNRLAALGIRYLHLIELAPSQAVRELQKSQDSRDGTGKRDRDTLSEAFVQGYIAECLHDFKPTDFFGAVGKDAHVIALFCVEQEPAACHRSIVASTLCDELGIEAEHIRP